MDEILILKQLKRISSFANLPMFWRIYFLNLSRLKVINYLLPLQAYFKLIKGRKHSYYLPSGLKFWKKNNFEIPGFADVTF